MCQDIGNQKTFRLTKKISNIDKTTFDIKVGLEYYIPSLLQLIQGDIRWKRLNEILDSRFNEYTEKNNSGERFELRMSLYSLCVSAAKGNSEHIQFLSFIDNVFKSLTTWLNDREKEHIKTNISNLLEYDEKFLNYLGELCALNCIMASKLYSLEKSEFTLTQGGVGIDFKFQNIETKKDVLVEVRNLELRADKLANNELIHKYLSSIFQKKLEDTDKSGITDYTLLPVLWGGKDYVNNILRVKKFYEDTNFAMDRVQTPLVYMQLKDGNKTYNKFGSILNCLNVDTQTFKNCVAHNL